MMEKKTYAQVALQEGGSTFIQPLHELDLLSDELQGAASDKDFNTVWVIRLVEMTEKEYEALPEFDGH